MSFKACSAAACSASAFAVARAGSHKIGIYSDLDREPLVVAGPCSPTRVYELVLGIMLNDLLQMGLEILLHGAEMLVERGHHSESTNSSRRLHSAVEIDCGDKRPRRRRQ